MPGAKPDARCLARQKHHLEWEVGGIRLETSSGFRWLKKTWYMRETPRGTISSNSRFHTTNSTVFRQPLRVPATHGAKLGMMAVTAMGKPKGDLHGVQKGSDSACEGWFLSRSRANLCDARDVRMCVPSRTRAGWRRLEYICLLAAFFCSPLGVNWHVKTWTPCTLYDSAGLDRTGLVRFGLDRMMTLGSGQCARHLPHSSFRPSVPTRIRTADLANKSIIRTTRNIHKGNKQTINNQTYTNCGPYFFRDRRPRDSERL